MYYVQHMSASLHWYLHKYIIWWIHNTGILNLSSSGKIYESQRKTTDSQCYWGWLPGSMTAYFCVQVQIVVVAAATNSM